VFHAEDAIDILKDVYLNGARTGGLPFKDGGGWEKIRRYAIRPGFTKAGRNVIAIRVFNSFGGGGYGSQRADQMVLHLRISPTRPGPYVPDWRDDYAQGDALRTLLPLDCQKKYVVRVFRNHLND